MDVRFINPVLESIVNILQTMASISPEPGRPCMKPNNQAMGVVTGIIDMKGAETEGSIAVTFSQALALEVTRKMLREEPVGIDATVKDLVGEITNMMAGGAKAKLHEKGFDFELAQPRVIAGKDHDVEHCIKAPTILLPFKTRVGGLFVEICFPPRA